MIKKKLLIISGGIEALPGIEKAKEMGLHVVVADGNAGCPGRKIADNFLHVSTYDARGMARAAQEYSDTKGPLNGVLSVASDVPLTVAHVASALKLEGISLESAKLASNKLLMKKKLKGNGIPVPWFQGLDSLADLKEAVRRKGLPLVLKPVDSRGARGVLRLTPDVDLQWAWEHSISFSPSKKLMVEEYLPGPQASTESVVYQGRFWHVGFSDRNYEYLERFAPFIVENGGELPTRLSPDQQSAILKVVEQASKAMGIKRGTIKGDMVLTSKGPYIIELAPRLSGGYFCSHEIPLHTGVDFLKVAIKIALGERPLEKELRSENRQAVVQRYFFPPPGRLKKIRGMGKINEITWLKLFKLYFRPGETISPVTSHVHRGGVFIAVGKDRNEALDRANTIYNKIKWIIA